MAVQLADQLFAMSYFLHKKFVKIGKVSCPS